jgi:hypothetical protein
MREKRISSLLHFEGRFLRSIQLERDYRDPSSLAGYVVTSQIRSYVERLALGLHRNSGQRAWRITGDYGSGKSAFALLVAHLFGRTESSAVRNAMRAIDLESLATEKPRLLPILVTGSRESLGAALLRAIVRDANDMLRANKAGILRKAQELLKRSLGEIGDQEVTEVLQGVAREVRRARKASGVLLLVDELGKFLEFGVLHPDRQDIYLLQRIAEAASHSGEECLFVVGLLHQGFSAYAENLSPTAQREWEKVAGRFEEMVFAQPLSDVASLVGDALNVKSEALPRRVHSSAKAGMENSIAMGWYGAGIPRQKLAQLASHLYPLHPTVLPVLMQLFRRFGQNERSLFGFMLSSEPFGLREFASSRDVAAGCFYEIHNLYDYARASFGNRLNVQSFRSHWNHIESLIESFHTDDENELRVLKTVGLLNVIDAGHLLATEEAICSCLGAQCEEEKRSIVAAVRRLRDKHILYYRGAAGGYCLWPHTSVNLEKAYEDACNELGRNHESVIEVAKQHLTNRPLIARRHYIETGNLRHFVVEYVHVDSLETVADSESLMADGSVVVVLCETQEQRNRALALAQSGSLRAKRNVLIAISQPLEMLCGLVQEVRRWEHIRDKTPQLAHDKFAFDESSRQLAVAQQVLVKRVSAVAGVHGVGETNLEWFCGGKRLEIVSGKSVTSYLSVLCSEIYSSAPCVHNELVNRRVLSSAAAAARTRLIEAIFGFASREYLGMDPTKKPPEMSMYLSLLKDTGIHRRVKDSWELRIPNSGSDSCNLTDAFRKIRELLVSANMCRVSVAHIFDELRKPPFGVRDGLLPILLAVFASANEQHVAFYDGGVFLPEMAGLDTMRLAKVPEAFEMQYCDVGGVRAELFSKLLDLIASKTPAKGQPELLDVVRPLCMFAAQLPPFTRNTRQVSNVAMQVREVLLSSVEPAGLVFRELPKVCGFEEFTSAGKIERRRIEGFVRTLRGALGELQMAYPRMLDRIKVALGEILRGDKAFSEFRVDLSKRARQVIIGVTEPRLKAFCNRLIDAGLKDTEWIESLGSLLCSIPPQKWTDSEYEHFLQELEQHAGRFERVEAISFKAGEVGAGSGVVRVCLTASDGSEVQKVIFVDNFHNELLRDFQGRIESMVREHRLTAQSAIAQVLWTALASEEV